jgi:hypothetical protein
VLGKLVNLLRGWLRIGPADPGPDEGPRYGASVSYTACPDCGEGSLVYDPDAGGSRCNRCGAVHRPED